MKTEPSPRRRKLPPVAIRQTRAGDEPQLDALQRAAYPLMAGLWKWQNRHWRSHRRIFPEGQFVAEVEGNIVGCCVNVRLPYERATGPETWRDLTDGGMITTHDPLGDALYGVEIMVHPDHRRRGIARRLYRARMELIKRLNIHYFCAVGRIPGFGRKSNGLTPEEYVEQVVAGRATDRTLTAQLRSGLRVAGVVHDYMPDPKSGNAGTILVWENPDYVDPVEETPTLGWE